MRLDGDQQFIEADERADRNRWKRQQAELFDPIEFAHTTAEEREIKAFYAHQSQTCGNCGHLLGMHDYPPDTPCMERGCECLKFVQTRKPVSSEPVRNEEAA